MKRLIEMDEKRFEFSTLENVNSRGMSLFDTVLRIVDFGTFSASAKNEHDAHDRAVLKAFKRLRSLTNLVKSFRFGMYIICCFKIN